MLPGREPLNHEDADGQCGSLQFRLIVAQRLEHRTLIHASMVARFFDGLNSEFVERFSNPVWLFWI
jgi:hypothetical protein